MRQNLFRLFFFFVLLILFASPAHAGGGQYHPVNFSWGQTVNGRSIDIEMEIHNDGMTAFATGEEFAIVAHHDLPGVSCETTQRIADSQGRIKGRCKADAYGHFVFDIQPVTKASVQNGVEVDVYFSSQGSSTGFPDQGSVPSVEKYEAVIVQSPSSAKLNQQFTVEAKAKKDGQILDDTSMISVVRWTVLKGSMVTFASEDSSAVNRKLRVLSEDKNTVIMAEVTLKSGEILKTPSKALIFAWPTVQTVTTVKATETAKASPTSSPKATATPKATPKVTPALVADIDASAEAEIVEQTTEAQVETTVAAETSVRMPWWKRVLNWLQWWKK